LAALPVTVFQIGPAASAGKRRKGTADHVVLREKPWSKGLFIPRRGIFRRGKTGAEATACTRHLRSEDPLPVCASPFFKGRQDEEAERSAT
jgi:hypothetical protein